MNDLGELRDLLVREGQAALDRPMEPMTSWVDRAGYWLVGDLEHYPHAFLFGCLMDRQIPAERAWAIPAILRERLGTFEVGELVKLDEEAWKAVMRQPPPPHRLTDVMAVVLHRATQRLLTHYQLDASRVWSDTPSSATLIRRFLEFHGAGPKIATMAANILARDFRVPIRDFRYIDISADVQVQRVMARLGYVEEGSSPEVVIYAARDLNPDYPGIFDGALWEIGRTVCRPTAPLCSDCRLSRYCAYDAARCS
jgi:uncharacterized HhH-GPD family protein